MLGGMAALWRWRARRKAEGKPTDSPNFVCGPVQVVWHKFARYWDVEIREIPMSPGRYCMDVEQMLAHFSHMKEIDVQGLAPTTHALLRENRLREDVESRFDVTEKLLENAPEREERFIVIPNVL